MKPAAVFLRKEEKMSNRNSEFQQAVNAAKRQGRIFADTARDLISEDATGLDSFVDMLLDFYYIADSRPFIDVLTLMSNVYGIGSVRFQHGIDHYKQFAGQGNRSPFGTLMLLYPSVPVCEISVPFSGDDPGNLTEYALKIGIALVDLNAFSLSCTLIVART